MKVKTVVLVQTESSLSVVWNITVRLHTVGSNLLFSKDSPLVRRHLGPARCSQHFINDVFYLDVCVHVLETD